MPSIRRSPAATARSNHFCFLWRLPPRLQQDAGADHVQHPRHDGQDGGADVQHIGGQVFQAAAIHHGGAEGGQHELAHRVLIGMGQRQVGQVDGAIQLQRLGHGGDPGDVGQGWPGAAASPRAAGPMYRWCRSGRPARRTGWWMPPRRCRRAGRRRPAGARTARPCPLLAQLPCTTVSATRPRARHRPAPCRPGPPSRPTATRAPLSSSRCAWSSGVLVV